MSDFDTVTEPGDDLLTRTFATFVAEASRELVVPGAAATRRTVRNQRVAVTLTSILAVAITGALVFVHSSVDRPTRPPASQLATARPALTEAQLTQAAALHIGEGIAAPTPETPVFTEGKVVLRPYESRTIRTTLAPGAYSLVASCVGAGWIAYDQTRDPAGPSRMPCSMPSEMDGGGGSDIRLTKSAIVRITFTSTKDTIGTVGIAFGIIRTGIDVATQLQYAQQAANAVGAQAVRTTGISSELRDGFGNTGMGGANGVAAGWNTIRFACVGAGHVQVTWTNGAQHLAWTVACDPVPQVVTMNVRVARNAYPMIAVLPALGGQGRDGLAFSIARS